MAKSRVFAVLYFENGAEIVGEYYDLQLTKDESISRDTVVSFILYRLPIRGIQGGWHGFNSIHVPEIEYCSDV
jgi:hypothetical protein